MSLQHCIISSTTMSSQTLPLIFQYASKLTYRMNMGQPLLCRLGQQEIYHSKYITNSHLILYQLENQAQPGNHTFSIKVNPSNIGHTNQTKKQRDKQRFIVVLTCLVNNFFAGVYFYPFANISSNMRLGGEIRQRFQVYCCESDICHFIYMEGY